MNQFKRTSTFAFILFLSIFFTGLYGQDSKTYFGPELQIYPTGILAGLSLTTDVGEKSNLYFRVGANVFDHRDLGKQDDEEGYGFGFSIGYERDIQLFSKAWRLGFINDVWFNNVDWVNQDANGNIDEGSTSITVLQPTLKLSYQIEKNDLLISPSLGVGAEWNVRTDGLPTGEGPILLLGIQLLKQI